MNADSPVMSHTTNAADETRAFGRAMGGRLTGGLVLGLVGPLGAGKTQLVKGIAVGNGRSNADQVTSPTFTLVHEYDGVLAMFHLDAYRLDAASALIGLGFDEMIRTDAVVIVEWADRVSAAMPDDAVWITIVPTGDQQRRLEFRGPVATIHTLTNPRWHESDDT